MSFAFCFGWGMGLIYIPVCSHRPLASHQSLSLTPTIRPCPSSLPGSPPAAA
jgi:hypothetical protein